MKTLTIQSAVKICIGVSQNYTEVVMLLTYSCSSLKNFSSKLQYPSLDLMYYCVYNAAIYWEYDEQKYNLPQEFVHCQVKPISQPLNDPHKQRLTGTHMHTKPLLTLLLFSGLV